MDKIIASIFLMVLTVPAIVASYEPAFKENGLIRVFGKICFWGLSWLDLGLICALMR